jgi:hypothetical protein
MKYGDIEKRLTRLEQASDGQQRDTAYEAQVVELDPGTQAALRTLTPEDREHWITGMVWFGSL